MPISTYQLVQSLNNPTGSSLIGSTGGVTYLVAEITDLKATLRGVQLAPTWISLLGLQNPSLWTGSLVWTYISATQASIQGNQTVSGGTGYIAVGNRVQASYTGGVPANGFGTITAATFTGGSTTATFKWDSGGSLAPNVADIQSSLNLLEVVTPPLLAGSAADVVVLPLGTVNSTGSDLYATTVTGFTTLNLGQLVTLTWGSSNTTTTPTLNLNGLGPVEIVNIDGSSVAVGQFVSGGLAFLYYNGAGSWLIIAGQQTGAASHSHGLQIITYADYAGGETSFTVPASVTRLMIDIYGAGGGGGGGGSGTQAGAGGGGGGGAKTRVVGTFTPGQTLSLTVGAAGAAGAGGVSNTVGNAGSAGGLSLFNGVSANGGGGGSGGNASGPGSHGAGGAAYASGAVPGAVFENIAGLPGVDGTTGVNPGGAGAVNFSYGGAGGAGVSSGTAPGGAAGNAGWIIVYW